MRIIVGIILFLQASNAIAQNNQETEYSINLTNYFYGYNIDYNTNGQSLDIRSSNFFVMQPSLRIMRKKKFTEIGFRNIALNDLIASKENNMQNTQQTQNMLCFNTSGSFSFFYAKSYKLLGNKKTGLWFGGDISYGYEYLNSLYAETTTGDFYEIIKKKNQVGIASVLRILYAPSSRINIDFAAFAQLFNYNSITYFKGPMQNTEKNSSFNFINFGYPQITFGFKL